MTPCISYKASSQNTLGIQLVRRGVVNIDDFFCRHCHVIKDERHVVYKCPLYASRRDMFNSKTVILFLFRKTQLSNNNKFRKMLNVRVLNTRIR